MIIGINKGLLVLKFNFDSKPSVVACSKLIELNDQCLSFFHLATNNLYEQAFNQLSNTKGQIVNFRLNILNQRY